MFIVCDKNNLDKELDVYNVRNDKHGYPHFLVYEDKQWKYKSAKYFVPMRRMEDI